VKPLIRRSFDRARFTYREAAVAQRRVACDLSAMLRPGSYRRILEIGCGGGFLHSLVRARGLLGPYLALDLSRSMLSMLASPEDPDLQLVQADGEFCPVRPGSVDLLLSSSTLQWFDRPETSIPGLLSLLCTGGRFAFSIFIEGTLHELADSSRAAGFGSVRPLRPAAFYTGLMSRQDGLAFSTAEREETIHLSSVRAVLQHLKDTGVVHTGNKRPFTRSAYHSFLDHYQAGYGSPGRVPVTFRVLFLDGIKQD
jgi:malonyl-CoA O-methyltransferase